jgi:DNA polymerase III alpha subunit
LQGTSATVSDRHRDPPPEFPERERYALEKTTQKYLRLLVREAIKSRLEELKHDENQENGHHD